MLDKKQSTKLIAELTDEEIIPYKEYWESLAPTTDRQYYLRWLFAFLSVHTTWNANVTAYTLLKDNQWTTKEELKALLIQSRCGLYERRTEGIYRFTQEFTADPQSWRKLPDETWIECRDRLEKRCIGLGLAKTAFALEMCYPNLCECVCLDTHMIQLYGFTPTTVFKMSKGTSYKKLEKHWIKECMKRGVPSYIARSLFWDKKKGKPDSRYWAYVFEDKKTEIIIDSNSGIEVLHVQSE